MGFLQTALEEQIGISSKTQDFSNQGFVVPTSPGGSGVRLPSSDVPSNRIASTKRASMHWFVPEFGVVKMYINPSSITYNYQKIIEKQRTKGGFSLQYWGEDLPTLKISGTTGSSGIEGINVLYEIYRAEQIAFDNIGLSIASSNSADGIASGLASKLVGGIGSAIGGSIGSEVAQGLFGVNGASSFGARNIPTLSDFAFGVEMFYLGWVHRGYFNSMNVTETADNLGLFNYDINFTVTERRGYRYNNFPWQKSATDGQSGITIPRSFSQLG